MPPRIALSLRFIPFVVALASVALANNYVIDANCGGDFLDLPQAIAAAAQGDVLLVMPGTYSSFSLDKRMTILGRGSGVRVSGSTSIHDLGTGSTTVVANLDFEFGLQITNCSCPVVFDSLTAGDTLAITNSTDVRCTRCALRGWNETFGKWGTNSVSMCASRVEFTECWLIGARGGDGWEGCHDLGGMGGSALELCAATSEAHVYRSTLEGGMSGEYDAEECVETGYVGVRGAGLRIAGADGWVLLAGDLRHEVRGGLRGKDHVGVRSRQPGLINASGAVRYSGVSISSIDGNGFFEQPSPADPTLYTLAPAQAGQTTTFRITAAPGATVDLVLGRNATIIPSGSSAEDLLVVEQRVFHLGAVGANGTIGFDFPVSSTLPLGFTFFAQARVAFAPNDVRYTNSVPLVLR